MSAKGPWWRDAVTYQVYPRSFRDSNGDGEGDLRGVIEGIPYIASLGVDAIWLSPFYKSPNKDGGYDVSDPRDVDPRFGNLVDARELIDTAHENNLRLIVDIVPNHFSSAHHFFQEALNSSAGSAARARFHFYDGRGENGQIPPNNWNSFFGGPAWTRLPDGQWYLHLFDSSQPDLNWENPDIRKDFEVTLRFWLDLGADGFRIDVAHALVKEKIYEDHRDPEGLTKALRLDVTDISDEDRYALLTDVPFLDREGVHEIYREWRKIINEYAGERTTVAEAWVHPSARAARYVRKDELHQIFNFDYLLVKWDAQEIKSLIQRVIVEMQAVGAPASWVLNNHDSPRVVSRLGDDRKARAFALLTHALPGSLYIYQGEELGLPDADMRDDQRQDPVFFRTQGANKGRDACRVPIPWNSDAPHFGFTVGEPWLPQPDEWAQYAMDTEESEPLSWLNFYRKSLSLRKTHPALGGEARITWHDTPDGVLVFSREPGLRVMTNMTNRSVTLDADALFVLHQSDPGIELDGKKITLPANTTVWLSTK
jgi:alpha-glucosidase